MDVLKRVFNPIKWFKRTRDVKCVVLTPEERLTLKLKPYQSYLYKLQEILMWKEPSETIIFVAAINVLFLLWARMEWRFYGVIFSGLLTLVLYEAWTDWIWPEIRAHPPQPPSHAPTSTEGVLSVAELSHCATHIGKAVTDLITRMKILRLKHPAVFCSVVGTMCMVVAKVGSAVPGLGLLYLVVMAATLGPGLVVHYVPPETKEKLMRALSRLASLIRPPDTAPAVEEYLPESSKENLTLFNLASGDFVDNTNGSTPNSEIEVMPEEPIPCFDESSMEHEDSLALDPNATEALTFKPTHFNGANLRSALSKALAETLGPALVAPPPPPILEDSDSSDFELIDTEDAPS